MHKIDINFRLSAQFTLLISTVILASVVIVLTLPILAPIKAFLLLFSAIYGILIFREHGLRHTHQAVQGLKLTSAGWFLRDKQGVLSVELLGESTITGFASVLRFKSVDSGKKRSCVVFNDALTSDDYRRLIVQLRASAAYEAERIRRGSYLSAAAKIQIT
jgi:hypothetical protein